MSQSLRRWSVFLPVALVAVLPVAARGQEAPLRSRFTARMAAVFDAEVCACDGTAVPTPRFRDLAIVAVGRQFPIRERATSRLELAWVPELIPILYSNRTASARLNVYSCGPRRYCGDSLDEDAHTRICVSTNLEDIKQNWSPISFAPVLVSRGKSMIR